MKSNYVETGDRRISSDNPEAISLLMEKLSMLESKQEKFKQINKIVKSKLQIVDKVSALVKMGINEGTAVKFLEPDFANRVGVPSYELTNNNANIRTIKKRIEALNQSATIPYSKEDKEGISIEVCPDDNRVKLIFDGKPSEEVRNNLKRRGFHWSPDQGAWMRLLNASGLWEARQFFNSFGMAA